MKTPVTDAPEPAVTRLLSAAEQQARQRRGVRRTAWAVGLVALAIYAGFILSGVLGARAAEAVRAAKPADAVRLGAASWPVAWPQAGESSPSRPRTAGFSPWTFLSRGLPGR